MKLNNVKCISDNIIKTINYSIDKKMRLIDGFSLHRNIDKNNMFLKYVYFNGFIKEAIGLNNI